MPRCTVLLPPDTVRCGCRPTVSRRAATSSSAKSMSLVVHRAKEDSATITLQWFDRSGNPGRDSVTRMLEGYADMPADRRRRSGW